MSTGLPLPLNRRGSTRQPQPRLRGSAPLLRGARITSINSPAVASSVNRRGAVPSARARAARGVVSLKRAYDRQSADDGTRVLVDRLWPRGVRKEQLAVDFWLKDLAPSDVLRRWYGHDPARWTAFADRYRAELARHGDLLHLLEELRRRGPLTLLYAARDSARNNAVVLRDVLEEQRDGASRSKRGTVE